MIMIYAEWELHGEVYGQMFHSWGDYHSAMFNPEINLLLLEIHTRRKTEIINFRK